MPWSKWLQFIGLALCVLGVGIIFVFGYPPEDEARQVLFTRLSRLALLLVFFGFLLQLAAVLADGIQLFVRS